MNSNPKCSLLVVDDEPYILTTLSAFLTQDFEVLTADSARAAQELFNRRTIDLILTDQKMPHMNGVQLLEWVRERSPKTIRLLMTGFAELEDAVEAINRGKVYRYLFKPWRADELLQVLRDAGRSFKLERQNEDLLTKLQELNLELEQRVQDRTRKLEEANHELQQKNLMLEKLALTDPLTSLPNRRAIDRLAESELRRRARYPGPLALGFIDADRFKEINDRYLLPGGDQVLMDLAKVLSASVRTVDTVGRIGGEEFMVVAPETSLEGAVVLGERIRSAVEEHPFAYKGELIRVTVSVGFAVVDGGVMADYDQLKHLSAAALAEAKSSGRNRSIIHALAGALL
ncbi:MAG TPA: diguanylate cyclase [Gemmataceae bacterium]|jgi:diguanylate cyclase (GGDEF)-like protein|nr:diguanylate cyclase [Gemmataceae bacterium]